MQHPGVFPPIHIIPTEFVAPNKQVEKLVERLNNREKFIISYCIHALSNIYNNQLWYISSAFIDNNNLIQNLSWVFDKYKEEYHFLVENYKYYLINDVHFKTLKSNNIFLLYAWHLLVAPYLGLGFNKYLHHSITDSLSDNIIHSIDIIHDNPVAGRSLLETLKSLDSKLKAETRYKTLLSNSLNGFYQNNKLDLGNETWLKKLESKDLEWCYEYMHKPSTLTMMGTQIPPKSSTIPQVAVSRNMSQGMLAFEEQVLNIGYYNQPIQHSWSGSTFQQQSVQMQWQTFNPLLLPYEYKMNGDKDSLLEFIMLKLDLMGNSFLRQNYTEKLKKSLTQKRYRDSKKNTEIIDVLLKKNSIRKLDHLANDWGLNRIQVLEKLIDFGHENESLFDE